MSKNDGNKKFLIAQSSNTLTVTFFRKNDWNAIRQLEFASRLMYGLSPDINNIWVPENRSPFHVVGFPPSVKWISPKPLQLVCDIDASKIDVESYKRELGGTIDSLCPRNTESRVGNYKFQVTDGSEIHQYVFNKRARSICALAVLYDLEWHPRKDLEIWINASLTHLAEPDAPVCGEDPPSNLYGDPSKTADELRNEGWSRERIDGHEAAMIVESRPVNGQNQQHYRLTTRVQSLDQQTKRSVIKSSWRQALFQSDNFTCQICLTDYGQSVENLAPDHRVPVIFEADELTEENFLEKLMTLCRFCNQSKREFAKRIDYRYDWESSPWAYPERFRYEVLFNQIHAISAESGETAGLILDKLRKRLGNQPS